LSVPPERTVAFKDHFSARSADYAARRPAYPDRLADWLAEIAPAADFAWDCGCGSGQLSLPLAERFAHVAATDASPQQLANAPPHPRVAYRRAPAEASGLPDGVADLIVSAQAAHWFDLDAFYAEARRVARPGAAIALISYSQASVSPDIDPAIRAFHFETMKPYWPAERDVVDEGYRSLPFPFQELPVPEIAMIAEWEAEDLLGYFDTWSSVRAYERSVGHSPIPALREALGRVWPAGRRLSVRWRLAVRAGRIAG
jgi:SAM-dependent methyltransferase